MADANTVFDPNAPAFGSGSQKLEPEVAPAEVEAPKEEVPAPETEVEESKVPYSRFKKFHDRAQEAEEEAQLWRQRYEALSKPEEQKVESNLPQWWVKLYGDNEASKEAWQIQSEQNEALTQRMREEALEAVRNEKYEEVARIEKNVEMLDNQFEDLSAQVGRDLTEKEESAILDIIDDYTPKDQDGNYAGPIIPMEKAWEIYELKNQVSRAPKQAIRDNIASLSASPTQGQVNANEEQNKAFNPLDWNSYKRRI